MKKQENTKRYAMMRTFLYMSLLNYSAAFIFAKQSLQ